MPDAEPLVTVATFDSLMHAELARGLLDAEGVRSFVADGEFVNTNWFLSGAVGGIKLQVAKSDFLAAERLLNSRRAQAHLWNLDDYGLARPTSAITTRPDQVRDEVDKESVDTAPRDEDENEAESLVQKALRAALVGFLFPPLLHLYSLWLLSCAAQLPLPLRGKFRKHYFLAMGLDIVAVFGALAFVALLFLGPRAAVRR